MEMETIYTQFPILLQVKSQKRIHIGMNIFLNRSVKFLSMLDQEWLQLILEAKQLGLTIEEIRDCLNKEFVGLE